MSERNDPVYKIEYRTWHNGLPPKRTKLDVGGWAGENTWKMPQAWHCKPYSDAATYGLDLIYNWETTCTVTCDDKGVCNFNWEGDFGKERPDYLDKTWVPFACFAPYHFGYVSMVDIKTPPNHNLMVGPHPRFFADKDGSTPCAVPGQLEMDWWPEIFFIVFKAPLPGCKYVFKKGDPVAQFTIVPRNLKYDIKPMAEKEAELRAKRQNTLEDKWHRLCTRVLYCEDGKEFFDNKYKVLSAVVRRDGEEAAAEIMDHPKRCPHYYENPSVLESRPTELQEIHHRPWTEEQLKKNEPKVKAAKEAAEREREKEPLPVPAKSCGAHMEVPDGPVVKPTSNPERDDNFYKGEPLGEVDELLAQASNLNDMNEEQFERLIQAFKRQRRKLRQDRSLKLKAKSDPKKYLKVVEQKPQQAKCPVDPKPIDPAKIVKEKDGEWVLGHRIEKIKK